MAKLSFGMMASLDGYISDRDGKFNWGQVGEDVHQHATSEWRRIGTEIYGRRMYEVMVYWETYDEGDAQGQEAARLWQSVDKLVVSTTLKQVSSKRTRIIPSLNVEQMQRMKAEATADMSISGPTLAAEFIKAGLVDEIGIYTVPVAVGGGTPLFADLSTTLRFERIEHVAFSNGVTFARFRWKS